MSKPTILVTSAAGNTGIPATLQLLDYGFPVRAFVRGYDHRAKRLEDAGAEIFVGDQYSIADMQHNWSWGSTGAMPATMNGSISYRHLE